MNRRLVATVFALAVLSAASSTSADVPLQSTGVEASGNDRAVEVRAELGDRARWGGFAGFSPLGDAFELGPTASQVFVRHRILEVRTYERIALTYFGASQTAVLGGRAGLRSVVRGDHLGFWLGPRLEAATELGAAGRWRFTPSMALGFGGGPGQQWPWLWLSGDLGYSLGGTSRGAVKASWFASLAYRI